MADAKKYIEKLYNHYADLFDLAVPTNITPTVAPHPLEEPSSSKRPAHSGFSDSFYDLNCWNSVDERTYTSTYREELKYYLRTAPEDRRRWINTLDWSRSNETQYSVLSRLARDILNVSMSTVTSKSAFSQGRQQLRDNRHSLGSNAMNVLVCLRDWIRAEIRNQRMEPGPSDEMKREEIMTSRENSAESNSKRPSSKAGVRARRSGPEWSPLPDIYGVGFRRILLYLNSSLFFRRGKIVERNESCIPVVSGEGDAGTKSEEKSSKKVRFSMKNNLVWKPNSPMPPQDFTVATYAYSPRQCFKERSASWPHKRSASLHEEDEIEKERPQDTKDRFPRHEAAEKGESYVFLVNFKLTASTFLEPRVYWSTTSTFRGRGKDSSFVITDFPKKSPHVSCYVEMKIFDILKQKLSGVQFRRFMGTCFDQYATMQESWDNSFVIIDFPKKSLHVAYYVESSLLHMRSILAMEKTRNLLRIAIFNISYIRGLFPEKYFSDKSVPALEMKIKKLMPMDAESRRLIDWMEKGVYDALQKKYLKTLMFCVCEAIDGPMIEEYAFSFSYSSSDSEEVSMNINRIGTKKGGTFKCNSITDITPNQMRNSACKMRTILMKLLYHDDVTPADYEPPFFRGCTDEDTPNSWIKNPLKLEVGNVNSKHFVLALKVKSVLDPCEDENDDNQDDVMSLGADSAEKDDSSSDSEFSDSDEDQYIVAPVEKQNVQDKGDMVDEDDTQDPAEDEQQFGRVKDWISAYHLDKVEVTDVLSNFTDISVQFDYEFDVVKEEKEGQQNHHGNQSQHGKGEDYMYMKALLHALPMNYVTVAKLQSKLEGEANQTAVKRLIDKMTQDGFVEAKNYRRLGKRVIHSDLTEEKLAEVKKVLAKDSTDIDMHESDNNVRNLSTCGGLHSIGSDLTRTRGKSDAYRNGSVMSDQTVSKRKEHENTPSSKAEPVASRESFVPGKENGRVNGKSNKPDEYEIFCSRSSQEKRNRKASMEDPQGFIDEMEKIFRVMHAFDSEGMEFAAYQLKDVAYQWYEEWDQSRGDDTKLALWDKFSGRNKCFRCGQPSHIQRNYPSGHVAIRANKVPNAVSSAPAPKGATFEGPSLQSIHVVCEFPKMFPNNLPGVPLDWEIDFGIDLLPNTHPISILPYRMAPMELKELKEQLKNLLDKNYDMSLHYHPSKANVVADGLSRLSIGSLSHVDEDKRELIKDIHWMANLGIRLLDSKDGGIIV
ncbi:hypothetical protein CQW23_12266 [Capsicum baccatum]|uniref:HORMA domain-containing protein n=1 Tax=Capsicum baccatum TaxID=33114 RepID=A0A2G2WS22_CAPBA|nr:hypothetical protein CQW23_12266 [Capsicum baccatum]